MNFLLPKIKLPFKKLKWVCTTDLILDAKTGKSIAANNDDSLFFTRFQNKTIEQITSFITKTFVLRVEEYTIPTLFDGFGVFKEISKAGVDITLEAGDEGILGTFTFKYADGTITVPASIEIDTDDPRVIIGGYNVNTENEFFEIIANDLIGPRCREILEAVLNLDMEAYEWMINMLREGVDITISE